MSDMKWLDLPTGDLPRAVDKVRPKAFPRTEKREELAAALKTLSYTQRIWLKALVRNGFNGRGARKELREARIKPPETWTVSRWSTIPNYVKARELYADMLCDGEAPTKSTILLRINKIAEYNAEEVDEMHQGGPTGNTRMRDGGLALKANEMLGKQHRLFAEDRGDVREGPMLVVQIVSKEDPTRVIDVTPGRVMVTPIEHDAIDAESTDDNP